MTELKQTDVALDKLLLDPNNYRYQDNENFVYAAEDRYHEETVQERASERLRRDEGLVELKRSIMRNGFVPVERLVIRPYLHSDDEKYVIIEGNRRYAAAKWVLADFKAGVTVGEEVLRSLSELPVVIAEESEPDLVFRASLMGIRHVSSIKQWGGYQRAKLIINMRDDLELDAVDVAERLGLSTQEVNRRYRAFKALQQMQQDEESEQYARPSMYPLFHEAVSLPILREWLAWNDETYKFVNEDNKYEFYRLLTPTFDEEGNEKPPKITTYAQVRDLRSILAKPDAKKALLDPHRPLQDAVTIARQEELSRQWASEVSSAVSALSNISIQELKSLTTEDIGLLKTLQNLVSERLADHASLTSK